MLVVIAQSTLFGGIGEGVQAFEFVIVTRSSISLKIQETVPLKIG